MNMSFTQFIAAVAMAGIVVFLVVAYRRYLAANSERRMRAMLNSVGLDPAIANHGDIGSIMDQVRQRCRSCASEAVCERWLAENERRGNHFCPNSRIFEALKKHSNAAG